MNKNVLIASSENAIRGLLMYLCEIPKERISEVEIPTGLPLVYDVKRKCIRLLDDGSGVDPLETYNFGKGSDELLFKTCSVVDEDTLLVKSEVVEDYSMEKHYNDWKLSELIAS